MVVRFEDLKITQAMKEDLFEIVNVLNKATLSLHQKKIMQWDYPWCEEEVLNDIDLGRAYIVAISEHVVGTFFIKEKNSLSTLKLEPGSMYLNQIAILPEYQGNNIGSYIIDYTKSLAQMNGKPLYLDCWAGNAKLVEYYGENGFKNLGDFQEGDYFVTIFKLK